ncbi:MraY family glycosyltransferase [Candidatus Margulisiibacteriota bacterium]
MLNYFDGFLIAFGVAFLFIPLIKRFAYQVGAIDEPNERKVHAFPVPRLGGVALYIGFFAALSFITFRYPDLFHWRFILSLFISSSIIVAVGSYDDIYRIVAPLKLALQIIAVLIIIFGGGVSITFVSNPFGSVIFLNKSSWFISLLWILATTNMVNLIDGLDGLAAGMISIISFTLALIAFFTGQIPAFVLLILLLGICVAFLRFNFAPATIFLGDSGSMFLGFVIGVVSIVGVMKIPTILTLIVPLICMGIPFIDTVLTVFRRLKQRTHIFKPDANHFHHRLLYFGFEPHQAVIVLYLITILLCLLAALLSFSRGVYLIFSVGAIVLFFIWFLWRTRVIYS